MASSFIVFIPVDGIDELSQDLHSFGKIVPGWANVILPVVQEDVIGKAVVNEPETLAEVTRLVLGHYVVGLL